VLERTYEFRLHTELLWSMQVEKFNTLLTTTVPKVFGCADS
jgi:hypothetical protein